MPRLMHKLPVDLSLTSQTLQEVALIKSVYSRREFASHFVQFSLPSLGANFPFSHWKQSKFPLNELHPAGHCRHLSDGGSSPIFPAGHGSVGSLLLLVVAYQPFAISTRELPPAPTTKFVVGGVPHLVLPGRSVYCAPGHFLHSGCPVRLLYSPGRHLKHTVACVWLACLPARHFLQSLC